MSLFDLSRKVAVVTGATKGIGRGIAQALADQGARIVVSSRTQEDCDAVAGEFGADVARGLAFDLDDYDAVEPFAAAAAAAFGGVDILVCNAAALSWFGPSQETPRTDFDRLLRTNVHHNHRLCEAMRPAIAARGGGSIILIGSLAGHSASPQLLAYAVSKAAVAHLARSLADEMAAENIRVNCVAPGFVRSWSSRRIFDNDAALKAVVAAIPLKRPGEPEDIGGAVAFLASRAGSYVTGETILVDGGRTMLSPPRPPV
jgi:NAD(P)-dependent dehydrogenase (short-subunit alcohol dehydrogenase family)